MPANALLTGPPRSGKTTAIERTVDRLRRGGLDVGGLLSPERRADGERVGFDLVDLSTDRRTTMAHVEYDGPAVGTYGIDVDAVDRLSDAALSLSVGDCDCVVIDELGPMQCASDRFVAATQEILEMETPVFATIAVHDSIPFLDAVRSREDVTIVEVTRGTRDDIPAHLEEWIRSI